MKVEHLTKPGKGSHPTHECLRSSDMQSHARARQRGMTLLELVIALAASLAVGASVFALMVNQRRVYEQQENLSQLQQSLRIAMDFIERNVTLAGYGTRGYSIGSASMGISGSIPALQIYEGGSGAPDALQAFYADPTKLAMTAWSTNQSCITSSLKFQNTSDVLYFKDNSYMVCFDIANMQAVRSFVLKVSSVDSSTGTVSVVPPTDNTAFSSSSGVCPSTENYPLDMQCGAANFVTFYIDRNNGDGIGPGSSTHPVLMMSSSPNALNTSSGVTQSSSDVALTDNMEDLQVQICTTTKSTTCDSAGWTNATSSDNALTGVVNLRQIRVTLWARGDSVNPMASKSASVVNPLSGAADQYQRQRLRATMLLRNLRLLSFYN